MKSLPLPEHEISDVLDLCGRGSRISRVTARRVELVQAEATYADYMRRPNIWEHPRGIPGMSSITEKDVSWAYDSKLQDKKGGARPIYDVLRSSSSGRCPICLSRPVSALDHYLPREHFPGLALQPTNLVPICGHCNLIKTSDVAASEADQFLHPYFDDLGTSKWIAAELKEEPLAPLVFVVDAQPHWPAALTARVENHFERFGLSELYAADAAVLLGSIDLQLSRLVDLTGGGAQIQALLAEMAESYWQGSEPWRAAALDAWSDSDWFCAGGWKE